MKHLGRFVSCRAGRIFILIISAGHNSVKNEDGVMFLFFCILPDSDLYLN